MVRHFEFSHAGVGSTHRKTGLAADPRTVRPSLSLEIGILSSRANLPRSLLAAIIARLERQKHTYRQALFRNGYMSGAHGVHST